MLPAGRQGALRDHVSRAVIRPHAAAAVGAVICFYLSVNQAWRAHRKTAEYSWNIFTNAISFNNSPNTSTGKTITLGAKIECCSFTYVVTFESLCDNWTLNLSLLLLIARSRTFRHWVSGSMSQHNNNKLYFFFQLIASCRSVWCNDNRYKWTTMA